MSDGQMGGVRRPLDSSAETVGRTPVAGLVDNADVLALDVAAITDVGSVRTNNEDAFLIWDLADATEYPTTFTARAATGAVIAVSDGMGGPNSGEVASRTTLDAIREQARRHPLARDSSKEDLRMWLTEGVEAANRDVRSASYADPARTGMGATLTVGLILGDTLSIAHVGDSRAYLKRGERLLQLTMDQTHVQELYSQGHITEEQARTHSERNLLLQAIGSSDSIDIDVLHTTVRAGDRILLCSDGLHGLVEEQVVEEALGKRTTPLEQCVSLVQAANEAGGHDNITAAIVHVA